MCAHFKHISIIAIYSEILEGTLKSAVAKLRDSKDLIFQQDNAPCHRANIVKDWFKNNEIKQLRWPANSPDLNCIENLWSWLNRQIANEEPHSIDQLREIVTKHMSNVPIEMIRNLIESMPSRIDECLKNLGGITRY